FARACGLPACNFPCRSAPWSGGGGLAVVRDAEPAGAVLAHVVDQGRQGPTLLGQRLLDPGRHLGIGVALDDAAILERPQPQRQGPWADPVEGALELAEATVAVGEVTDDQQRPLARDDLGTRAHGAICVVRRHALWEGARSITSAPSSRE